jgi:hypothetical protein
MHKIPEIDAVSDDSLEEARGAVTSMAREYQRRVGGVSEVFVVFDGKDEYRGMSFDKPNQVFSRTGQGDKKVIQLAHDKVDKFHVVVASDDNYVGNSCRAAGATVITISEFYSTASKRRR